MSHVNGLHHITAIAGAPQENLDFYADVLGMRLVKRSVNQDDPIRGGRFVAGFAGEQFAKPDAVDALRVGRHLDQNGPALRIAAADPLNLAGILTPGPRVSPLSAQDVALLPAGSGQDLTPRNAA